jgi:hypothetical protein
LLFPVACSGLMALIRSIVFTLYLVSLCLLF